MKNNTRKIVVLDTVNSSRIEQAIFILRDIKEFNESAAVTEAERIVNSYLSNLSDPLLHSEKQKKPKMRFFIAMALYTLSTVLITICLSSFIH